MYKIYVAIKRQNFKNKLGPMKGITMKKIEKDFQYI